MLFKQLALLGTLGCVAAQRPSNVSICDYYTAALLKENTAANQHSLLTLVVNTAAIGNYTTPNVGIMVTGILNEGVYNGKTINLLPYFDGGFVSTNNGGSPSVMSFLDGGGAEALKMSLPAFDNTSNQYFLLTHLYEYFGILLGCSQVGLSDAFPAYGGDPSMYDVHKFMALSEDDVAYFITQVGNSALSFGVTSEDATAVGDALTKLFNYRCIAPEVVIPDQGTQLNSICLAESCPLDPVNATCNLYDNMDGYSPQPASYSIFTTTPASMTTTCEACGMTKTMTMTVYVSTCPMASGSIMNSHQTSMMTKTMSSAAMQPSSKSCPITLSGEYQFPHLIIPVSSASPTEAYGTSYFGEVSSTVSSIFNFDIPSSYGGAQCSLVFLFPMQDQLQTSSYTFSGSGGIEFQSLMSPATEATSYSDAPGIKQTIGTLNVAPGNSYVLANYPCPAGETVSIKAMASGDVSLKYFQDYNPSPIGLYITKC